MAENYGILVCLIIMALDVVAGILGIEAEIAQNKVKHSRMWIFDLWSTEEDFGKASAAKKLAAASLFISWIVLAIGFTMLTIGTMANSKSIKSCGLSHHHMLSIGGILCFIHGIFAAAYYVSATASETIPGVKPPLPKA
ncbi:hypothetical protein OIU76_029087 [Salix suchowensis]|nr:hypothetical protein OIU76_029087 [Salix suchowensis]